MIDSSFAFINANGGVEQLTNYYNALDEDGKTSLRASMQKVFKEGDAFESQVLFYDKVSKMKDYGTLGQLMCDLKDGIIKSSVKSGKRTIDDWRLFLRREQERGNAISLGVLDEMEGKGKETLAKSDVKDGARSAMPDFPIDLIDRLYEYDDTIFKHISSLTEFRNIILRFPHKERLVECDGRKIHLYHMLWRLHKLPPSKNHSQRLEDICSECGYRVLTVSKKFNDTTMRESNRKLLEEISRLFDRTETRTH